MSTLGGAILDITILLMLLYRSEEWKGKAWNVFVYLQRKILG